MAIMVKAPLNIQECPQVPTAKKKKTFKRTRLALA